MKHTVCCYVWESGQRTHHEAHLSSQHLWAKATKAAVRLAFSFKWTLTVWYNNTITRGQSLDLILKVHSLLTSSPQLFLSDSLMWSPAISFSLDGLQLHRLSALQAHQGCRADFTSSCRFSIFASSIPLFTSVKETRKRNKERGDDKYDARHSCIKLFLQSAFYDLRSVTHHHNVHIEKLYLNDVLLVLVV